MQNMQKHLDLTRTLILIVISITIAAGSVLAAPNKSIKALSDSFDLFKEVDTSRILSQQWRAEMDDSNMTIQADSIYDYFRRPDRIINLARWEADEDVVERADSILINRYHFWIHAQYELPEDPTWKENPGSNRNWVYHLHSFDFVWILNEAFKINGNSTYLNKGMLLLEDYLEDNCDSRSMPCQLAWSDHTAANRMIFLTDFWQTLVENEMVERHFTQILLEFFWRSGRYLENTANYHAHSNHGLFNAAALLRMSLSFPEFNKASVWRETSIKRMYQQMRDNFSDIGIHKEYSPWYQIWSVAVISKFIEECKLAGIELETGFLDKYGRALKATEFFIYPDNMISLAGDSGLYPNEILMKRFVNDSLSPPSSSSLACLETGIFVMRRCKKSCSDPVADESRLIAFFSGKARVHDHVDPLNFELYSNGVKWITDSGRYAYEYKSPRRKYVESHRAHNSVVPFVPVTESKFVKQDKNSSQNPNQSWDKESVPDKRMTRHKITRDEKSMTAAQAFITKNADDFMLMQASTPEACEAFENLFIKVSEIDDVLTRIEIAKRIKEVCPKPFLDKVRIMLAVDLINIQNIDRAEKYLNMIAASGIESEYYALSKQLLNSLKKGYQEPVFSDEPPAPSMSEKKIEPTKKQKNGQHEIQTTFKQLEPAFNDSMNVLCWATDDKYHYVEGSVNFEEKFTHSRAILFVNQDLFIIVDKLSSRTKGMRIEQLFHFPPEMKVVPYEKGGHRLTAGDFESCLIIPVVHPPGMDSRIVEGQTEPFYQGWVSYEYNKIDKAPVLVNTINDFSGTAYVIYLVFPAGRIIPGRIRLRNPENCTWTGTDDKPLRILIPTKRHNLKISYMPSRGFILADKNAPGGPVISIRKKRR